MLEQDIAYELGWEHARHSVCPPAACLTEGHPVRQGYEAGREAFGGRARSATPSAREWLSLRLQAWMRGRCFETLSLTPMYLRQIRATHCPVTRQALTTPHDDAPALPSDTVVARLCDDAGYAAGHLAQISVLADVAKSGLDLDEALQTAQALAGTATCMDGLDHDQWLRLSVLMSFVTPLPHGQAAALPLRVLPPNRLHVLNPVQGLQAVMTRALMHPEAQAKTRNAMMVALESAPGAARLPALLEAFEHARQEALARCSASHTPWRWAIEDAWADAALQHAWTHWADALDATVSEQLLDRLVDLGLAGAHVLRHSNEQSTAGWSLGTRGFIDRMEPAQIHHLPVRPCATPDTNRYAA